MFAFVFRFSGALPRAAALPFLLLTACAPGSKAPEAATDLSATTALTAQEPETCDLAAVAAVKGPSRLIGPGEIVDQEDYVPQRINAYSDKEGIITRLECG